MTRLAFLVALAMLASSAQAGDKFVVAGFSTKYIEGHSWAIPLCIETGICQKNGLDVEVVTPAFNIHRTAIRENVENPAGGVHATLLAAVGWNALGQDECFTAIVATNLSQASELVVRKGFEMKPGLRFAVIGPQGAHHRIFAALYGVTGKEEPFSVVTPGLSNLRLLAVRDGAADGTLAPAPQTTVASEVYGLEVIPVEDLVSEKSISTLRTKDKTVKIKIPSSNFFFADCEQVKRNDRKMYTRFAASMKETVAFALNPANESRVKEVIERKLGTNDLLDRLPEALKEGKIPPPPGLDINNADEVRKHVESIRRAMVADILKQIRTDPARDGRVPESVIDLALEIHFTDRKTNEEIKALQARWRTIDPKFFSLLPQ